MTGNLHILPISSCDSLQGNLGENYEHRVLPLPAEKKEKKNILITWGSFPAQRIFQPCSQASLLKPCRREWQTWTSLYASLMSLGIVTLYKELKTAWVLDIQSVYFSCHAWICEGVERPALLRTSIAVFLCHSVRSRYLDLRRWSSVSACIHFCYFQNQRMLRLQGVNSVSLAQIQSWSW